MDSGILLEKVLAGRILAVPRDRLACAMELAKARLAFAGAHELRAGEDPFAAPAPKSRDAGNGVRVVDACGMLSHGMGAGARWWFGCLETEEVADAVCDAVASPKVRAVVFRVNSPGGMVQGIPEAAARIAAAAEEKPVVAFTSTVAASAAYWLAAGCSAIYATPTADLGSVGCFCIHTDLTGLHKRLGIVLDVFKAPANKAAGVAGTALTEAQREMLQSDVDGIAAEFRAFVLAHRPQASAEVLDGRALDGRQALAAGLSDETATEAEAVRDAARLAAMAERDF